MSRPRDQLLEELEELTCGVESCVDELARRGEGQLGSWLRQELWALAHALTPPGAPSPRAQRAADRLCLDLELVARRLGLCAVVVVAAAAAEAVRRRCARGRGGSPGLCLAARETEPPRASVSVC